MHNKKIEQKASSQSEQKLKKKGEEPQDYSRRLERKPSSKQIRSPKHRLQKVEINTQINGKQSISKLQSLLQTSRGNKNDNNTIGKNICYLSPKHSNVSYKIQNKGQGYRSKDNLISVDNTNNKQKNETPSNKKKTQTTKNQEETINENGCSMVDKTKQNSLQKQQLQYIKLIKIQNKQLFVQNRKLHDQLKKIKSNNQQLMKQIKELTVGINQQKNINNQLLSKMKYISEENQQNKCNFSQFKKSYKIKQNIYHNYQILQRLFKKVKEDYFLISEQNKVLLSKNSKLSQQIVHLSRLLKDSPSNLKSAKKKSNDKQLILSSDKQNCQSNRPPPLLINNIFDRLQIPSRKDDNFFDLSPE